MASEIDPASAIKVVEAFEAGTLDHLFRESNVHYFDREGFDAARFSSGLPREAVWRLISAVRRSTGLPVFESAWGDYEVRVSLTAQLMKALYEIDTWSARSLFGKAGLPPEEEWIVRDRLLVEEAVLIALGKTTGGAPSPDELDATRAAVIGAIYDEKTPAPGAELIATRFYKTMRQLPELGERPLTPEFVADIHRRLRDGEPDAGVFRTTDAIASSAGPLRSGTSPDRIEGELQALCAYAESDDVPFIHPLIKTLALAWWLRHVQPFAEYNYLVSRLVSMGWALRHGYQLTGIADPQQRLQASSEHSGDQTGRFIRQLEIVRDAKLLGEHHLLRRVERYTSVMDRFGSLGVNHRQAFILDRAILRPETTFTIKHHARTRQLAYETARQDLLRLVDMGLLEQHKRGRAFEFRLAPDGAKKAGGDRR